MTNQQKEQLRTMRLQGVGYIKIGKALGISDNTVRSFCVATVWVTNQRMPWLVNSAES